MCYQALRSIADLLIYGAISSTKLNQKNNKKKYYTVFN